MRLTRRGEVVMAFIITPLATLLATGLCGVLLWMLS